MAAKANNPQEQLFDFGSMLAGHPAGAQQLRSVLDAMVKEADTRYQAAALSSVMQGTDTSKAAYHHGYGQGAQAVLTLLDKLQEKRP